MTKRLLWFAVFSFSCMPGHGPADQQLRSGDCYQCHVDVYEDTPRRNMLDSAIPDHLKQPTIYTQQCATCHVTTTWDSHPNVFFPIDSTSAHKNIECTSCHANPDDNSGDAHGANTKCATCHPATEPLAGGGTMASGHTDQAQFSYSAPPAGFTAQNFCVKCHPTGAEKPHNNSLFPQSHHANTCTDCHDRTKGSDAAGQNAMCQRCHHNLSGVGDHPGDVNTEPPSRCLSCHPGGGGGGN